MRLFLKKAANAYAVKHPQENVPDAGRDEFQQALLRALGGQKPLKQQLDEFDMAAEMRRLNLEVCCCVGLRFHDI